MNLIQQDWCGHPDAVEPPMNSDLDKLQPYPFEKLLALKAGILPPEDKPHIALSIGEPKHPAPDFVAKVMTQHLSTLANYPVTRGQAELRQAICDWLSRRYALADSMLDPEKNCLPVSGTREALFAITQTVVNKVNNALVLMPNPFYQIYEGAALLAGAQPWFMNTTVENDFIPDLNAVADDTWSRCQLIYVCTPGNPAGGVLPLDFFKQLYALADKFDFVIASDECYSEIYPDESNPPLGMLEACHKLGRDNFSRCLIFNSLSKRSNLPGLRSGFVAGDENIIARFLKFRTYHGCAMPLYSQQASIAAWQDELHVIANRALYREKFAAVNRVLGTDMDISLPDAGFYLWPATPLADEKFAQALYAQQNVTVLPGSYLSRPTATGNPGEDRVRIALVAPLEECEEAAQRIKNFIQSI